MFIDTHCHMSKSDYESVDQVIKNAKENNVKKLIICGCDKEGIKEAIELANNYENIYLEIGYHPSEVETTSEEDLIELEEIARNNKKVVAIGEIGLDYHWEKEKKEEQKELFKKQIEIAKRINLPIVIHSRDSFQDTYDILKESGHYGDIHCFSGNLENAKMYIKLGFYLGIGGVVTFKNTNLKDTLKEVPLDRIILETDSPYLAPTPHRGEKNEPKYIPLIAEELSTIYNKTIKEIEEQTTKNVQELFKININ